MDAFEKKTITTSRGYTWTYYVNEADTPPANIDKLPVLFFQHGWPDHAELYAQVVHHLREHGVPNKIVIPDMLGYDGTSKPTDPQAYTYDKLTTDLLEILDAESIPSVISIGHDWGSRMAQRLYNFHPSRVSGLILLNVAYTPPQREPFSLQTTNALTKQLFGYGIFEYWDVFAAPDGPDLLKSNVNRLFSAIHAAGTDAMRHYFCHPGAMREYLTSPESTQEPEVRAYASQPGFREAFVTRMKRDGFEAPQNWYVATNENVQLPAEAALPVDRDTVNVPVLYIGCTQDAVCRPEAMGPAKQAGLLPDLEEAEMIIAGHWGAYEKPAETAERMADWLGRRFPWK